MTTAGSGNGVAKDGRPLTFTSLSDSTAVALENVRAYQELEHARLETLQRLALAAEYRDDATHEHTERVARTASLLAERLGLPESFVSLLRQAAPLHDIGKLAVSDTLLLEPGRLTRDEFEQVKGHAAAGAAILEGSTYDVLCLAREIALTHHEWWDGSGYPAELAGEAVPLSGRIVALADVFDALTHPRPYKPAWPIDEAVAAISRSSGRQFDPPSSQPSTSSIPWISSVPSHPGPSGAPQPSLDRPRSGDGRPRCAAQATARWAARTAPGNQPRAPGACRGSRARAAAGSAGPICRTASPPHFGHPSSFGIRGRRRSGTLSASRPDARPGAS
jgi:putative two-component system response regulator